MPDEFRNLNNCEKLTKLQHFGCPTRFLDITTNPLVALYFACKGNPEDNGYVYVFFELEKNILSKNNDRTTILSVLSFLDNGLERKIYYICEKKLNEYLELIKSSNDLKKILTLILPNNKVTEHLYHEIEKEIPLERKIRVSNLLQNNFLMPPYNNIRIERQSGAFIMAGLTNIVFDNNENNIFNELIQKDVLFVFKIPKEKKNPILKVLDKLGINEKFLFPDLEHCANYYKEKYKKSNFI